MKIQGEKSSTSTSFFHMQIRHSLLSPSLCDGCLKWYRNYRTLEPAILRAHGVYTYMHIHIHIYTGITSLYLRARDLKGARRREHELGREDRLGRLSDWNDTHTRITRKKGLDLETAYYRSQRPFYESSPPNPQQEVQTQDGILIHF